MGRYARSIYGASPTGNAKYGLDLWSEYSVEPMTATTEVDPTYSHVSSFTDDYGRAVYDRVQVSWLAPNQVDRLVLLRSNLGYPTSPVDPFAKVLVDGAPGDLPGVLPLDRLERDPWGATRHSYLDSGVETGREFFYAVWVYLASVDEWILAGRASTTTNADHQTLDSLKGALPAWMTNAHGGPGDGVAVLDDPDDENQITRWLQSCAWQLDKSLTKIDLLRNVWDPQLTPAVLLDDAVAMYGLPVEPALGARAQRALLQNAAAITGGRGSLAGTQLLIESLTGFHCSLTVGANRVGNTDESSFEGLTVAPGTDNVIAGTGRWHFENATLTRVLGDGPTGVDQPPVRIARDANSDDDFGNPTSRFGLRLDSVYPGLEMSMTLGERIAVTRYTATKTMATIRTRWVHGLEDGDSIMLTLDDKITNHAIQVHSVVDDFTFKASATHLPANMRDVHYGFVPGGALFGGLIPVYQGIPVDSEGIYSMIGMFKANNASNFTLRMRYYDEFGALLDTEEVGPDSPVGPLSWKKVYIAGSAPEGACSVTLTVVAAPTGTDQYLCVDSLMVKPGGTPYDSPLPFESATEYQGQFDYTFEDAQLLTIDIDPTRTPAAGKVPVTIQADLWAVIVSRLIDVLAKYLPSGTAFRIRDTSGTLPLF